MSKILVDGTKANEKNSVLLELSFGNSGSNICFSLEKLRKINAIVVEELPQSNKDGKYEMVPFVRFDFQGDGITFYRTLAFSSRKTANKAHSVACAKIAKFLFQNMNH